MPVNTQLTNRDIVVVGQQPWDTGIGSNCINIALEFSKNNRVLYVNSPLDRITAIRHKTDPKVRKRLAVINGEEDGLTQIESNLWNLYPSCQIESINWIKFRSLFNRLNKQNNRNFGESIQKAIDRLGFKNVILFNDNDMFRSFYLKEILQPSVSIYYSRDYMLAVDYWKYHGEILEPALIAKSDICVANSTYLGDYCRKYNPASYYVGQGCDLSMFTNSAGLTLPADMAQLPHPVIGYLGALQSIRLDVALLEYIAASRPEWSLVLVGPEDEIFKSCALHNMANVHFLGSKQQSELPDYINAFDVCINPQLVNQVTIGNYPRKIDEYLAMGKPVVATNTEAMSIFAMHTYLAETREQYLDGIERALKEDSAGKQENRKQFAATHSWKNNVAAIYEAINEFVTGTVI